MKIGMSEEEIAKYVEQYDYDIRKSHDARWLDQKCTMDVLSLIADCIIEHTKEDFSKEFTVSDIWHSQFTIDYVQEIFQKPNPELKAQNEYDKWFGQPIKLLSYSKILKLRSSKGRNYFYVNNRELLEYISIKERNALKFLCIYIKKVLQDSGIYPLFEEFFLKQDKYSFIEMKKGFSAFTIENTPINGELECNRIFNKVLNPLAFQSKKFGTAKGSISKDVITQDMLMYNQKNWRDRYSEKPKDKTREEYEEKFSQNNKMTNYKIQKAKRMIRGYNDKYRNGESEVYEEKYRDDLASQIHHIFPSAEYETIADSLENLIALTPTQHFLKAHPNNNTNYIDRNYQSVCLTAKIENIKKNIYDKNVETIYDFEDLIFVLNTGFQTNKFDEILPLDFDGILATIYLFYT